MCSYRRLYFLFCCLLISFSFVTNTTAQPFYIKKYTVNDGLPASYILEIYQDSQGFLWIGTLNGLSRFDGKEFVNYGFETGLPNLMIDAIYEDHQHRLWAGTRKGMAQIRGGKSTVYPVNDNQEIRYVFRIQESRGGDLWALTDKGLYQFEKDHWKKIRLYPGLENHQCRNIIETDTGMLINYGNQLVFKKNNGGIHLSKKNENEEPYYNNASQSNGHVYVSTGDGLFVITGKDTLSLFSNELKNKHITGFLKDSRNRFWVCTLEDGFMVSAPNNTEHFTYKDLAKDKAGFGFFFEDNEGNIWMSYADGLLKIKTADYVSYDKIGNPLIEDVSNLILSPSNKIIAACNNTGLFVYDDNYDIFRKMEFSYSSSLDNKLLPLHAVDARCFDEQNRLWLISREPKLYLLADNVLKDISELIQNNRKKPSGIDYNRKNHAIYICNDTLQLGNENGLHNFKSSNGGSYIVSPGRIHYFSNGQMLVWTFNNGFFLIDQLQNCFPVDMGNTLQENIQGSVNIYNDPSGKFWLTSHRGMVRYRWNEKLMPVKDLEITTKQGLPSNIVGSIAFDSLRRIWAITLSGIAIIEIDTAKDNAVRVTLLSEEQGIVSDKWAESGIVIDARGNVWVGLPDRILRFKPGQTQLNKDTPSIAIDNIQLNFKETEWSQWSDSLQGFLQLPYYSRLPYNKNNLSISYKGIAFAGNSGLLYSYRLEGADSNWSEATKNTIVSFVSLPAGKYIFQVRARKSNSEWSPAAVFSFIIQKPFWETWSFRLLAVAAATFVLGAIFRNRIRRVRKKALMQQQLQELEMKALKSQMNPHFIYNAMNSIQALVLAKKTEEASLYISKFGRLLRQVLDNSEKSLISLENELQSLELYIQVEKLRLNVDLQYHVHINDEVKADEEQVPPLIFQPFVENALWHGLSNKDGEKRISVSVDVQAEWLLAEIEDNGIGRIEAESLNQQKLKTKKSKGIEITTKRLIEFNKTPGIPVVEIKDLYNEHNQAAGTKVLLRIKRFT